MEFHDSVIQQVEKELDLQLQGRWRRDGLMAKSLMVANSRPFVAVWNVEFIDGDILFPNVTYVCIGIDGQFPRTQPTLWLPQYVHGKSKLWPHIENNGVLCLPRSSMADKPELRVIQHFTWAKKLLRMDPVTRRKDFMREAVAYWSRSHCNPETIYSLVSLKPESRIVVYSCYLQNYFVADTPDSLSKYLHHRNNSEHLSPIYHGYLIWLESPWCPNDFPDFGHEVLEFIPIGIQDRILEAGRDCLILIGTNSENGVVLFSAMLKSRKLAEIRKGFRDNTLLPAKIVRNAFHGSRIRKMNVLRVDGDWVHGRDHDPHYKELSGKRVVVCGCGSLGASIARLLAQAGVGTLYLIDADTMSSYNASRHLLGVPDTGVKKVTSLRRKLLRDFPHINAVIAHNKWIEDMSVEELEQIRQADIFVSCGITLAGDLFLDDWRRAECPASVHVCVWTEAFAVAGHAIALFGNESLSDAFDENMEVKFRLCDISETASHLLTIAGCGDMFQPHGVIELQPTVNIGARVVVDVLTGNIVDSIRRTWFGSRTEAERLQLRPRANFVHENCVKDFLFK